jgi:hypothetical protein
MATVRGMDQQQVMLIGWMLQYLVIVPLMALMIQLALLVVILTRPVGILLDVFGKEPNMPISLEPMKSGALTRIPLKWVYSM